MGIQRVTSGIFKYGRSSENLGRASIAGTVFVSIDENNNITGDVRVHDGIRKSGMGVPPPGTVSHIIPRKNSTNPDIPIHGESYGFDEPDGWLFCDGRLLDKEQYGSLYYALGDIWNVDTNIPSDKFQIPDLRGYYIRCHKGSGPYGAATKQLDTVEKHSHYVMLQQAGDHTHRYINWNENVFTNTSIDTTTSAGVLTGAGLPGASVNSRAVWAVAYTNTSLISGQIIGTHSTYYDIHSGGGGSFAWSTSDFSPNPPQVMIGEGYTRKMGTYQNGTWQQTTELHEHAMSTLDSSGTTNPENPGEGSCTNIRIPTFIKY